jgi:hypothetical protein
MPSIAQALAEAASRYAHRAIGSYLDDDLVWECPACGLEAAPLQGHNSLEVDVDVDDGVVVAAGHYVEFQGEHLECLACGLELDGQDQLGVVEIEAVFPNDAADLDSYLRDYYEDF